MYLITSTVCCEQILYEHEAFATEILIWPIDDDIVGTHTLTKIISLSVSRHKQTKKTFSHSAFFLWFFFVPFFLLSLRLQKSHTTFEWGLGQFGRYIACVTRIGQFDSRHEFRRRRARLFEHCAAVAIVVAVVIVVIIIWCTCWS